MGFGAGGAATFVELKDTPETYSGQKGKLAKVKATEDGIDLSLLLSFTDWYAGGVPTDFPWVFEANMPCAWANPQFSSIVKNCIGSVHLRNCGAAAPSVSFNIVNVENLCSRGSWHC